MLSSSIRRVSPEVLQSDGGFLAADREIVDTLKAEALKSEKKRCRLCFHADPSAAQQEMLIVMHQTSYVCPHRHFDKVETLGVLEGCCDTVLFDEDGTVTDIVPMTAYGGDGAFFYRMPTGVFHTLIFRTEWLVFVETTIGPFVRENSESAKWAPPETDPAAGHAFLSGIETAARA